MFVNHPQDVIMLTNVFMLNTSLYYYNKFNYCKPNVHRPCILLYHIIMDFLRNRKYSVRTMWTFLCSLACNVTMLIITYYLYVNWCFIYGNIVMMYVSTYMPVIENLMFEWKSNIFRNYFILHFCLERIIFN